MARNTGRIPVRLPNGQNAAASLLHERFGKLLIAWLDHLAAFRTKRPPKRERVEHPELNLLR